MPEYSTDLPAPVGSPWLWLVPALFLGAAALGRVPRWLHAARVTQGLGAALGAALAVQALAADGPLFTAPASLARIAGVDLPASFCLDGPRALVLGAISLAGAAMLVPRCRPAVESPLGLGGLVLVAVADTPFSLVAGATLAALGWVVAAGAVPGTARRVLAASSGALLLAAGVAWATLLAGTFGPAGYSPALTARLVAATSTQAPALADSTALLGSTAWPGATISLGGAVLCEIDATGQRGGLGSASAPCRVPATTPAFELPLPAGLYTARVHPFAMGESYTVEPLRLEVGQSTRLVRVGATASLREGEEQLALRASSGRHEIAQAFAARRSFGVAAPEFCAGLVLLGLWLALGALVAGGTGRSAAVAWCATLPPLLALAFGPVLSRGEVANRIATGGVALLVVLAGARALRAGRTGRLDDSVCACAGGLGLLAALLEAPWVAAGLAVAAVALAALGWRRVPPAGTASPVTPAPALARVTRALEALEGRWTGAPRGAGPPPHGAVR